jgi:hypothetical protein
MRLRTRYFVNLHVTVFTGVCYHPAFLLDRNRISDVSIFFYGPDTSANLHVTVFTGICYHPRFHLDRNSVIPSYSLWHPLKAKILSWYWLLFAVSFLSLEVVMCRSQWPRDLRYESSSPVRTLGSWVRIPIEAWMSVCVYTVFVLFCA